MYGSISQFTKPKSSLGEIKESITSQNRKVPSAIMNFAGPTKLKTGGELKQQQKQVNSNFLITLNTNKGYKNLTTDQRVKLSESLHDCMTELGQKIQDKSLFKCATLRGKSMGDCANVEVKKYEFSIEIGNNKGHIHSHAVLMLDGVAQIDLTKANELVQESLASYYSSGTKPHLQVKYFPSTEELVSAYIVKAQD